MAYTGDGNRRFCNYCVHFLSNTVSHIENPIVSQVTNEFSYARRGSLNSAAFFRRRIDL